MDVPHELASLPNWVRWDENKIPLRADGITRAKSNDPSTWSSFDDVKEYDRIGFALLREDGIVGIDLDGAIVGGELADWAQAIVEDFNSYTEISPSGTGIHIFCKGDWPANGWHKVKVGEKPQDGSKQPGIEVYNHERYFTVTGKQVSDSTELRSAGDALQRLFATHHKKKAVTESAPQSTVATTDERIRSYLAKTDISISGQHGHDRAMWAARCLVTGFRLDYDTALAYLREWNAGCQPAWSDAELIHKVTQAIGTPCEKPDGWLLVDRREQQFQRLATASQSTALATNAEPNLVQIPGDPGPLSHDFFQIPGLIQEMVAYHMATAPRQRPELSLAATIALLGTITGRKIESPSGLRTNIYCIGLADSGSGKEKPRSNNVAALTSAMLHTKYLGAETPASDSALISGVSARPSMLMQIDEISKFFNNVKDAGAGSAHLKQIFTKIMEIYTASDNPCWAPKNFADKEKDVTIAFPHLCIYGTCTPEGFWKSVKSTDATDGFLARMMVIEAPAQHPRKTMRPKQPVPQSIVDKLLAWDAFWPGTGNVDVTAQVVPFDSAAVARLQQHNNDIEDRLPSDPREKRPLWSRTSALAEKLAMIFAASRGPVGLIVTLADAEYAVRLANWTTRLLDSRIFTHVTENPYAEKKKRVLMIVRDAREISWRDLTRKTQFLNQHERDGIVGELADAEYVTLTIPEGRSRPLVRYLAG